MAHSMSNMRINRQMAELVDLDSLPGGSELYEELADIFLDEYEGVDEKEEGEAS